MIDIPSALDEESSFNPFNPASSFSISLVMVFSISSGETPSWVVVTRMFGISTSGAASRGSVT